MGVEGDLLWEPPSDVRGVSKVGQYMSWLEETRGLEFADYQELWEWSVTELEDFWESLWQFFEIRSSAPYEQVLSSRSMPGAEWFPGARLNYAEHILDNPADDDAVAIMARSQTRGPIDLTHAELRQQVARARAGFRKLGVGPGDRVVAYLPNIPETLVAFLACASLGAVWASCAPEFGVRSVVDRFSQIEPKVLLAIADYRYGDKPIDRREQVAEIRGQLPTLEHVIQVPYGDHGLDDAITWAEIMAETEPLDFEQVAFNHPLYVLFSSGTTGLPKAIVHGHGGILLEHLKNHVLSWDFGVDDCLFWFTTTAWMMWNALISSLLSGTRIVMLDGNPLYPDLDEQWRLAEETRATFVGANPGFVMGCRTAGVEPTRDHDLSRVRVFCSAGAPLPVEAYEWITGRFGPNVLLNNGSGGTDVCCGMVQGNMMLPVWSGEISGRCLGVKTAAYDEDGNEVVGQLGELVITEPMPSMPVAFWNDPTGERYHSAYFDQYPGVWRQGDWVLFTERGSCLVTGRSDATLNRGGVRLGTGEFYRVVQELEAVADSIVVHLEDDAGGMGELILFVVLDDGRQLDKALEAEIRTALKTRLSPRHSPDTIVQVPDVPLNLTRKKLELPVKRILKGADPDSVASRDALANPESLDHFIEFAAERP